MRVIMEIGELGLSVVELDNSVDVKERVSKLKDYDVIDSTDTIYFMKRHTGNDVLPLYLLVFKRIPPPQQLELNLTFKV